jgi:shikimate kinase
VKRDKIYLVGFMGAGKTTLARRLARRLGWRAEDLDELVETREKQSITTIFRERGELYFRGIEREVLWSLFPLRDVVVATGGGTFVDPENRAAMLRDGTVIWLDVPFATVVERVPRDGRRPLAADRQSLQELYAARRPAYSQAHLRVESTAVRPETLVDEVLDRLGW